MSKSNIAWFVGGIILFIVVTGLVTYAAVMHETTLGTDEHFSHNEAGFMPGWPEWEEGWFPLGISTNLYTPDRSYGAISPRLSQLAVRQAALWNRAAGRDLFYTEDWFGRDGHRARIYIDIGVPAEEGWMDPGGTAQIITASDGWQYCLIQTSNTGTTEILAYVIQHELGHCLGLAHDDWEGSIMRRVQSSPSDLGNAPRISDHDRALLRRRYGER